jgi:hypothetical protein
MALGVFLEFIWVDFIDVALIDDSWSDEIGFDQFSQPRACLWIVVVVECVHFKILTSTRCKPICLALWCAPGPERNKSQRPSSFFFLASRSCTTNVQGNPVICTLVPSGTHLGAAMVIPSTGRSPLAVMLRPGVQAEQAQ